MKLSYPFGQIIACFVVIGAVGCGKHHSSAPSNAVPTPDPTLTGGSGGATVQDIGEQAFADPLTSLSQSDQTRFSVGDSTFESPFIDATSGPRAGLGPHYNNTACQSCHLNASRGFPLFDDHLGSQVLLFTSVASGGQPQEPGGPIPAPVVGLQLQDQATSGVTPTGKATLTWEDVTGGTFGDGTPYTLRKPVVTVKLADGTTMPSSVLTSLRQPSAVFGLGLIEAIPDSTLQALAADSSRVPGQVSMTWSLEKNAPAIGRFGKKAARPTVREQVGKALYFDIGITNTIFKDPSGAASKISDDDFETLTFYVENLAVPARRNVDDPQVQQGEALFYNFGCVGCHQPDITTGDSDNPAFANQLIHPYSDLLLHDMGPGLADGRPEFSASGSQWRTPLLWGIGLAQTVRPGVTYLHDGRARSLQEAILWHDGQALERREAFRTAAQSDRDALIKFLESL